MKQHEQENGSLWHSQEMNKEKMQLNTLLVLNSQIGFDFCF